MKNIKTLLGISALAVAAATAFYIGTISANAATKCTTRAECACQVALDSGSSSALRTFMRLYPHSDTACNAVNSTAVIGFDDNQGNEDGHKISRSGRQLDK
jgi:hypothetical protein